MFVDMTIGEFLDKTAAGTPTPGGGSVCALTGALAASLSIMVGELTVNKDIDEKVRKDALDTMEKSKMLLEKLKKGIDEDPKAFDKVMEAIRLPKVSDDDKKKRIDSIQKALKEAAETPYEVAKLCIQVMEVSIHMLKIGNKNAASDAAVSGYLAYAALNGAIHNVKINLNSIKDVDYVNEMKKNVDNILSKSEKLFATVKSEADRVI